jgi:hypothetical protein
MILRRKRCCLMEGFTTFLSWSHVKIVGASMVMGRTFHTADPQILSTTFQNVVSMESWSRGFVHSCFSGELKSGYRLKCYVKQSRQFSEINGITYFKRYKNVSLRSTNTKCFRMLNQSQLLILIIDIVAHCYRT